MNKILQFNEWISVNRPKYTTTVSGETAPEKTQTPMEKEETTKFNGDVVKATNETIEKIVRDAIREFGHDADLNFIDTSDVTDMYGLFMENKEFNGDISKWNVSKVENMCKMFRDSKFNGDISGWDVSHVENMEEMFKDSQFNGDISRWDVSNVENFDFMFEDSEFNNDISEWNVSNSTGFQGMFYGSKFNGDLSKWRPNENEAWMRWMFEKSNFDGDISGWNIKYEKTNYNDLFNEFKTVKTLDMFKKSPLEENPPKWYIPHYRFILKITKKIPEECIEHIVSSVKNFRERYQKNLDSIEGWGTPLKKEDPEFFKELLDSANEWSKKNNKGYIVNTRNIERVFDPNVNFK